MKAQAALEFVIGIGFLMIVTGFLFVTASQRLTEVNNEKDFRLIKSALLTVKQEIDTAHSMQPGYTRKFWVPDTLEGKNYSISLKNYSLITITMTGGVGAASIHQPVLPTNGSLMKGNNTIRKREDYAVLLNS